MKIARRHLLTAARGLTILYALFLALFALDVFRTGDPIGVMVLELIIHLAPTFLLLFLLAVTWKKAGLAAIAFLGIALLFTFLFHTYRTLSLFALLSVPLLLVSAVFALAARRSPKILET